MKIIFLLIIILFSSVAFSNPDDTALRRSNRLLRFIAEQETLRNTGMSVLLGTRCSRYMTYLETGHCKAAVKKMIKFLDYDVILPEEVDPEASGKWAPSSYVFVAFKQKLMNLMEDSRTKPYLKHLNEELYKFLVEGKTGLNIWSLTKKHFKTDYSTAMAIAVLFQDTSSLKLHLAYMHLTKPTGSHRYEENRELLDRVIDTINLVLDNSEEHYRRIFYPESIQKDLNRNIYHFYVPLFLAIALEKEGMKKEHAYVSTLMLTLSYEFITYAGKFDHLFQDPERIDHKGTLKDIFGGYCGSMFGSFGEKFNRSFVDIENRFSLSTEAGVELLLAPMRMPVRRP